MMLPNITPNEFRGKKKGTNEWVYGYLAAYDLICPGYPQDTTNATGEYYGETPYVGFIEVESDSVGQYIGDRDENRNPVFVGDLLRYAYDDEETYYYLVVRTATGFGYKKDGIVREIGDNETGIEPMYLQVMGNIHDDPSLAYYAET